MRNSRLRVAPCVALRLLLLSLLSATVTATVHADITVDGDIDDWTTTHRINNPLISPPTLPGGIRLYGKYAEDTQNYLIAIDADGTPIGPNTTLWLNVDRNAQTGYRVWGSYGGAEYFINVYTDGTPHLYSDSFAWKGGPLQHAYSADGSVLELAVPVASLAPLAPGQDIDLLGDLNDQVFLFPENYADGAQYTIVARPEPLPPRTDPSKRVGIVYSEATRDLFFSTTSYSHLFMSAQHQAMMAGIPFDVLSMQDLTDIANLVNYDALIFPYAAFVPVAIRDQVHETLFKAVYDYGIGIITADNWMTNDEAGNPVPGDSYRYMKQLLGIGRVDGDGPVAIETRAGTDPHPAIAMYDPSEPIIDYDSQWYSYFAAVPGQPYTTLAVESVTGGKAGTYPAVLATETGGRHAHFAMIELLGDTNLLWSALQWVVFGEEDPIGLKMTRNTSLFFARNDTDQAMEYDEVPIVHVPLLSLMTSWKQEYDFVGSFFLDIGNNPAEGQWTDWWVSAPLFQQYLALGNEVGTHSWTHPHFTDELSSTEIEVEFNQSMNEIAAEIGPTWRGQNIRGGAVPGAPESLATAQQILQYLDYLTGGYSGVGAGYPSAFGYQTPDSTKVYLSPNMSFDFTLIEWGVPVGNPPVPVPLSAEEAEQYWQDEYSQIMAHASQPIVLWPWHDYGPTTSSDPVTGAGYTVEMFESLLATAYQDGAEFLTAADLVQRIETLAGANLQVEQLGPALVAVTASGGDLGKFSLAVPGGVRGVAGWYAFNDQQVFLDQKGGTFEITLGGSPAPVTRIAALPMRSRLIDVSGDGQGLSFSFEGAGRVKVALSGAPGEFSVAGADALLDLGGNEIGLDFDSYGVHTVSVVPAGSQ